MKIFIWPTILFCLMLNPSFSVAGEIPPATENGALNKPFGYSYLPGFHIDSHLGLVYTITDLNQVSNITDCSDSKFYCLKSYHLNLSWPKKCNQISKLGVWVHNFNNVKVVAEYDYQTRHEKIRTFVLANNDNYKYLYGINKYGLVEIFYNSNPLSDLGAVVNGGRFSSVFENKQNDTKKVVSRSRLTSLNSLGACD